MAAINTVWKLEISTNEIVSVFKSGHVQKIDDEFSNNLPLFKMHLPLKPYFTLFNHVLVFQKALQNLAWLKVFALN